LKFWGKSKFKKLQNEWYRKLEESGFKDAEIILSDQNDWPALKQRSMNVYRQAPDVVRENKTLYFTLLGIHASAEVFDDHIKQFIMFKRAEGNQIQEISKELQARGERSHRQTIRYVIRFYENKWGVRKWTQKQLSPPWMKYKKTHTK
jgi:hypothetical protein